VRSGARDAKALGSYNIIRKVNQRTTIRPHADTTYSKAAASHTNIEAFTGILVSTVELSGRKVRTVGNGVGFVINDTAHQVSKPQLEVRPPLALVA
jgi:hypothetical protein